MKFFGKNTSCRRQYNKGAVFMAIQDYTAEDFICDESFQHYCLGSDLQDLQFWENWVLNNPGKSEVVQEAIRVISILNAKQGNLHTQANLLKDSIQRRDLLKSTLENENNEENEEMVPAKKRIPWLKYTSGIAAALLALAIVGQFFFKPGNAVQQKSKATSENTLIRSGDESRKTIVLSDGSVITLHNNSSITLVNDFSESKRELTLSGEAFFDIRHDKRHPFTVHTAKINIEVLGTIFSVKAYPGDKQTEASLFTGKVAVSVKNDPGQKIILKPNEKVIFNNNILSKIPNVTKNYFHIIPASADSVNQKTREIGWVHNRLKIDDEPLEAIADKLQKWYGIDIVFSDEEVKSYRYSGTFESETIVQALEALQLSYPFKFKIEKEKITIYK